MAINEDLILHDDFAATQTGKEILGRIKWFDDEKSILDDCVNHKSWPEHKEAIETRILVHDRISDADIDKGLYDLKEGVQPTALSLTYAKTLISTKNYGTHIKYTSHDVKYNVDSIVADAGDVIGAWAKEFKNIKRVKCFIGTGSIIAPVAGNIISTFDKAEAVLRKMHVKKVEGRFYRVITTTEVVQELTNELTAANHKDFLSDRMKDNLYNDYAGTYRSFDIYVPSVETDLTVTDDIDSKTYQYIVFLGKTNTGEFGVDEYTMKGGSELINHPLGTGLVKKMDATGAASATDIDTDSNNQIGSIAYNLYGFSDNIRDQRTVLSCKYELNSIDVSSVKSEVKDQNGYVADSTEKSPK